MGANGEWANGGGFLKVGIGRRGAVNGATKGIPALGKQSCGGAGGKMKSFIGFGRGCRNLGYVFGLIPLGKAGGDALAMEELQAYKA